MVAVAGAADVAVVIVRQAGKCWLSELFCADTIVGAGFFDVFSSEPVYLKCVSRVVLDYNTVNTFHCVYFVTNLFRRHCRSLSWNFFGGTKMEMPMAMAVDSKNNNARNSIE